MSTIVDNFIAYRILSMLVKPFVETDAFKFGIIDEKGKILRKARELKTAEERKSYTYLHRLVFSLKRILLKLPGGDSKLKNLTAALFLIKESYRKNDAIDVVERKLLEMTQNLSQKNITLVEEELLVVDFLQLQEDISSTPTMSTGSGVSTDIPVIKLKSGKRYAAFTVNDDVFRRFKNGKKKFSKWSEYLNMENEGEQLIYNYAMKHPRGVLVLKNGKQQKAIRFNTTGGGNWHKISRGNKQLIETENL